MPDNSIIYRFTPSFHEYVGLYAGIKTMHIDDNGHLIAESADGIESDLGYASDFFKAKNNSDFIAYAAETYPNKTLEEAWISEMLVYFTKRGKANGIATLDAGGKVPASQLPSYIEDVVEGYGNPIGPAPSYTPTNFYRTRTGSTGSYTYSDLITPETSKIYSDKAYERIYRYSGSKYILISSATDVLKDTAGAGDTQYTWTADKLATKFESANPKFTGSISLGRKANTEVAEGSIAGGLNNTATGLYSQAFGSATNATGNYSHAEGGSTTASGDWSHAEGTASIASGLASHAEGYVSNTNQKTTASATAAHAEGYGTTASSDAAHSEGRMTVAGAPYSHSEGNETIANHKSQHVFGEYNVADPSYQNSIIRGNFVEIVGNGTSDNDRSNARALDWDGNERLKGDLYVNCGVDSTVGDKVATITELNEKAPKASPVFTGNISLGRTGTAGGNSIAVGSMAEASGSMSSAFGYNVQASGAYSHAEGTGHTSAQGIGSHAEGSNTRASGNYAHSEGDTSVADGNISHAEGFASHAKGNYSHAEGRACYANGESSHAEGQSTNANGPYSHAEGFTTVANGSYSHVSGKYNRADTYDPEEYPDWEAGTGYAVGDKVLVTTEETFETNTGSTYTTVTVQGYVCRMANSDNVFTPSKWTAESQMNYVEIVGNGKDVNNKSNARALDWDGNEYLNGNLYVNCDANSKNGSRVIRLLNNVNKNVLANPLLDLQDIERKKAIVSSGNPTNIVKIQQNGYLKLQFGQEIPRRSTIYLKYDIFTTLPNEDQGATINNVIVDYAVYTSADANVAGSTNPYSVTPNEWHTLTSSISSNNIGSDCAYIKFTNSNSEYSIKNIIVSTEPITWSFIDNNLYKENYMDNPVFTGSISNGRKSGTFKADKSVAIGNDVTASGPYSHAEGNNTKASGSYSHAEGSNTEANQTASHAEGTNTIASANYAHAEGYHTTASGNYAHAEGSETVASGWASHAEGSGTIANCRGQHVFGKYNIAEDTSPNPYAFDGRYIEIVGNGLDDSRRSNARMLDFAGNEFIKGDIYVNCNESGSNGSKVLSAADKGVANGVATLDSNSKVTASQIDENLINDIVRYNQGIVYKGTIGTGGNVNSLPNPHYAGWTYKVIQEGTYAGKQCYIGDFIICTTSGQATSNNDWDLLNSNVSDELVSGPNNSVNNCVAVFDGTSGKLIKDSGYTISKSVPSNAVFTDTKNTTGTNNATNTKLYVVGASEQDDAVATNTNGNVYIGADNCLYSNDNKVLTNITIDDNAGSSATDKIWSAGKTYDETNLKAPKVDPIFTGSISLDRSGDVGSGSIAVGDGAVASGNQSSSFGYNTKATGLCSFAEGSSTTASGQASHAEGSGTKAVGEESHAEGYGTIANGDYQHVFGKYNDPDTTSIEIVGNGSTVSFTSNARTLDWSGNERLAGYLYVQNYDRSGGIRVPDMNEMEPLIANETLTLSFEQGTIVKSGSARGTEEASTTDVRTGYIYCPYGYTFTPPTGFKGVYHYYDSESLSSYKGYDSSGSTFTVNKMKGYYLRIVLYSKTSGTEIIPSDIPSTDIDIRIPAHLMKANKNNPVFTGSITIGNTTITEAQLISLLNLLN